MIPPNHPRPARPLGSGATARILIATPVTGFSLLLEVLLSAQGYDVLIARRHEALFDLLRADAPDLVLLHTGRGHTPAPPGADWPPLVSAVAEPLLLVLARSLPVGGQATYRIAHLTPLPVRDSHVLALVRAALSPGA